MISFKLSLAIVLLMSGTLLLPSNAHDGPEDYLIPHAEARKAVGLKPLIWDKKLEAYAKDYTSQRIGDCELVHSEGPYGENLAWCSDDLSVADAVKMWTDEGADYDYNTNNCCEGKECGHYKQVVWRDTTCIGCAKVRCNNGGTLISCNYNPPGNYEGQKPY
ncbi:hypothetical protein JCGZ_06951 [Jatropha curcas]|uniref:SCP domain-containing protein n=1 Tax=Jatropha curcas TaxID=180498 RepID=A0A067KRH5_JATCU|nr:hypothetical protein JCGZ_06951 [Jatropha curcas]